MSDLVNTCDKTNKNIIKTSVRELVEFILRSGDLVSSFTGSSRTVEAIKAHQYIQKSSGSNYCPEFSVCHTTEKHNITLEVKGRIDGVITELTGITIDEIKTTTRALSLIDEDYNELHWAQAKCYGYIYSKDHNLSDINIQLTYYQLDTKEIKHFKRNYSFEELEEFYLSLVDKYIAFAKNLEAWIYERNFSISNLTFPFKQYRKGQREFAVAVYKTIREENKLFAQAPTGIGKTMATLFPSLKNLSEGNISKIFYLTAKTITASVAENSINALKAQGLKLKTVTLTAKDKICFQDKSNCNPETCKYAKGHFDRVNEAMEDIFQNEDNFTREIISSYATKHNVCPFEFSLDLCNLSDCIICDYNYAFDSRASLKRFFQEGAGGTGAYLLLVDEAHNLVDRAREMFSAEIFKAPILELKREAKTHSLEVHKSLNKLNSHMIALRKECEIIEESYYIEKEVSKTFIELLNNFIINSEKFLVKARESSFKEKLLSLYFEAVAFIRTAENFDERYVSYVEVVNNDVKVKLFCLDPSKQLAETCKQVKSTIFFSATLNPIDYFIELLGGNETSYRLKLESPFSKDNLCLLIDDKTSTRYNSREFTFDKITKNIHSMIINKKGNYLVFFPSYKYMMEIFDRFIAQYPYIDVICQKPAMTEAAREDFLKVFTSSNKGVLLGFAVMGGIFGEGIDLVGDRLSGAVIVGVGLPQICLERNIIKDYFQKKKGIGFEYSYTYPGMNKVMQAVGRVIRTETDKGVVMLIDDRFSTPNYKNIFPREWSHAVRILNHDSLCDKVKEFWK